MKRRQHGRDECFQTSEYALNWEWRNNFIAKLNFFYVQILWFSVGFTHWFKKFFLFIQELVLNGAKLNSNPISRRNSSVCLMGSVKQETQPFWIRSTQSSTSQREGLQRSIKNMKSDRLKQHPGNQTDQKQQSDVKTSLNPHLEEINQSEQWWQREWLALGKQS